MIIFYFSGSIAAELQRAGLAFTETNTGGLILPAVDYASGHILSGIGNLGQYRRQAIVMFSRLFGKVQKFKSTPLKNC